MGLVELDQLSKRVLTDDITVEDKERLTRPINELVSCQSQGTSCAHGLCLLRASDLDFKLALKILQKVEHHLHSGGKKLE